MKGNKSKRRGEGDTDDAGNDDVDALESRKEFWDKLETTDLCVCVLTTMLRILFENLIKTFFKSSTDFASVQLLLFI